MFTATLECNFEEVLAQLITELREQALHELRQRMAERFQSEGALHGPPWVERKREKAGAPRRPLLVRSARLRDSFTVEGHPEQIAEHTAEGIRFGSRVPYATYHQFGTRHIPRRQILTPEILGGFEIPALSHRP